MRTREMKLSYTKSAPYLFAMRYALQKHTGAQSQLIPTLREIWHNLDPVIQTQIKMESNKGGSEWTRFRKMIKSIPHPNKRLPDEKITILHNWGMGDSIICNALVRNFAKTHDTTLLCLPKYEESIRFMYRDTDIKIKAFTKPRLYFNELPENERVLIGGSAVTRYWPHFSFDECFYMLVGMDPKQRWTKFHLKRDRVREAYLTNQTKPTKPYAFLHECDKRRYYINRTHVGEGLEIIKPDFSKTGNIFDYLELLEGADEIHCICSSFKHVVDYCINPQAKLFYHLTLGGTRKNKSNMYKDGHHSGSRLNWKLI